MTKEPIRGTVLSQARAATCGPREESYGDVYDNMQSIAVMWNAYLNSNMRVWRPTVGGGWEVEMKPDDVAHMMALLKMARTFAGGYHADNYIDSAAYEAIAAECRATDEGEE